MKKLTFPLAALVLTTLVCVCATDAAVEPLGPFSGKFTEGFETQQVSYATELPVFGGESTVRNLLDGPYLHLSGYWVGIGVVSARSGISFMGSVGGGVEWIFDVPAGRFGGYFTVLNLLPNTEGAVASFYDVNDNLLAQMDVNAPYSTWVWNGWVSDVPIKRVEIIGLGSSGWLDLGGFVMHDDMEYTPFGEPGTIHYVDYDATGANDGSSWEDAFIYLQDALAAAYYGDEILVAQGIYKPDQGEGVTAGNRTATFQLVNGVSIKGGYAGFGEPDPNTWDIDLFQTILSGDLNGDDVDVSNPGDLWYESTRAENSYHVVVGSGTDDNTVLYGFTINGGNANRFQDVNDSGGGIYNSSGSPMLINCTFTKNSAGNDGLGGGGGMYNDHSNPKLIDCEFIGNSAGDWCGGGGMYNEYSNPTLINCTFIGNTAEYCGGGIINFLSNPILTDCTFTDNFSPYRGGGIHYDSGSLRPILTHCTFIRNRSDGDGGAIFNFSQCSPEINKCTFNNNSAGENGGAIANLYGNSPQIMNCLFTSNTAGQDGGGIYNYGYYAQAQATKITGCTFGTNSATNGSAIGCDSYDKKYPIHLQIINCIIRDGENGIWNNDNSTIIITYSDVQGGWPGEGNIDIEPLFADASGGDYHLQGGSPCIDAGTDAGVYEDIEGNIRPFDFPAIDNNGELPDFDMGAYEAVAVEGELKVVPRTVNRRSEDGQVIAVMRLPISGAEEDIIADEPLVLLPGDIEAVEQKIMPTDGGGHSNVRIRAVFDKAELLEAIPDNGEVEVTIIGRLISGQQFYGTDTIKIINSRN